MTMDLDQLPIPDWGLECPVCRYPLKGLPSHRCPECGTTLQIEALIRPWTRLRAPRFTGDEWPLPDFGLTCAACAAPLAGSPEACCPKCGAPFDPQQGRPAGPWFDVNPVARGEPRFFVLSAPRFDAPPDLALPVLALELEAECIPHMLSEQTRAYSGAALRLQVSSEFYFDFLHLMRRLQRQRQERQAGAAPAGRSWKCPACAAVNPGHFEICWSCQRAAADGGPQRD